MHSQQKYTATGLALYKNILLPAIHRASPVYSQMEYIGTGLALYKNILLPIIHKLYTPVYSQIGYIGTGLVYTVTHSTDGAILLSKLLVQSN